MNFMIRKIGCFILVTALVLSEVARASFCANSLATLPQAGDSFWDLHLKSLYVTQEDLQSLLGREEKFDRYAFTVRRWERKIVESMGHGYVYRGMAVSTDELKNILLSGLEVKKTNYIGIFYDVEPSTAISFAYERLTGDQLAIVLALEYLHETIVGRSHMTKSDIPPAAIAGLFVFAPKRDQTFPFEFYRLSDRTKSAF